MAIHLLTSKQIAAAPNGHLNAGGGLVLRVDGEHARWWFPYTSPGGQRRAMSLGTAAIRGETKLIDHGLRNAREIASEARSLLSRGQDPLELRNAGKAQAQKRVREARSARKRERTTLARVARAYHETVIEKSRTPLHAQHWIDSLENHLPSSVWDAPIDSISAPTLLDVMTKVQRKVPETATRIRQRLEAVFNDAALRGLCMSNPARTIRRPMSEALGKRQQRALSALPYAEVPAFVAALRKRPGTAARALEFALLTTARTCEVIGAQWSEFNLDAGLWIVPGERMKAGEDHTVFLSPRAVALLSERKNEPQPFSISNWAMLMLVRRMGYAERTTVHGLCRASFSTWANDNDIARTDVIEACLAHREADLVRKADNRAHFSNARKDLLFAWAIHCYGNSIVATSEPSGAVVVPLAA